MTAPATHEKNRSQCFQTCWRYTNTRLTGNPNISKCREKQRSNIPTAPITAMCVLLPVSSRDRKKTYQISTSPVSRSYRSECDAHTKPCESTINAREAELKIAEAPSFRRMTYRLRIKMSDKIAVTVRPTVT